MGTEIRRHLHPLFVQAPRRVWTNIAIPQSEMRPSSHCFFLLLSGFWVTPCYANMALTGQRRSHCFCQTKNRWRVGHCCLLKMSDPVVRHTAHLNTSFSVMCILTSLFVQTDQSHKRCCPSCQQFVRKCVIFYILHVGWGDPLQLSCL